MKIVRDRSFAGRIYWNKEMKAAVGNNKVYKIARIKEYGGASFAEIKLSDTERYMFDFEALELVNVVPEVKIKYEVDGALFDTEEAATGHVMKIMIFQELTRGLSLDGGSADILHENISSLVEDKRIAIRMKP